LPPAGAAVKSLLFRACAAFLTFGACIRVSTPQTFTASRVSSLDSGLRGVVRAPGDKSMSHRALIFGGMAEGVTEIEGLLEGDDILATGRAMQAFGAGVERIGEGRWRVEGRGALRSPEAVIDCGNAGTGVRLLMGAAAGYALTATFDGDASLRKRPMKRVTGPLADMGARFDWNAAEDRVPLTLHGGGLKGVTFVQSVASAQIKSAILLAGLNADGETVVVEPEKSRDHTERMLRAFGAEVEVTEEGAGWRIRLSGGQTLKGTHVAVPGDPSSAAFPLAAALVVPGSEVTVEGVMLNPLRTGLFQTWLDMGADLTIANRRMAGGEEVGDVTARHSALKGVVVPEDRAASMIDEYPILAATAAFAEGRTVMRGIGEMRVKESDRIALMVAGLSACGVQVQEEPEGFIVTGAVGVGPVKGGATVDTAHDHRIAMSHLVLGLAAEQPVSVRDPEMIATSFPGFVEMMNGLGGTIDG
jgi:3-phosphoshikimate 1-carboxyvinyltransferase